MKKIRIELDENEYEHLISFLAAVGRSWITPETLESRAVVIDYGREDAFVESPREWEELNDKGQTPREAATAKMLKAYGYNPDESE